MSQFKVGDLVVRIDDGAAPRGTIATLIAYSEYGWWQTDYVDAPLWCYSYFELVTKPEPMTNSMGVVAVPGKFESLAVEIGKLTDEKNQAYGNSAATAGQVLKLYYPNGVKPEQYNDMLLMVRILDKLSRVATRKDAFGESPFRDIAGYGLIGAAQDSEK